MKTYLVASVSLLALSTSILAEETIDLGDIIVSAGEAPIEENRTGVTVEVVDETAIAQAPRTRVAETLGTLPGVSLATNGPLGTNASVSIRGLPARYVGVRINGIDVTDPSSVQTQYNFGGLTSAGLGRIEVLKGSQSAVYGSEAIGGVIDIRSVRLEEDGTEYRFGVEYGTYDTFRADFTIASKAGPADISLTLSHTKTDGFSAAEENDGNTEADGFTGTTVLLSGGYAFSPELRLGLDLIYQDEELNVDAFGGAGGDADRPYFTERRGGRIYATYDTGSVFHELAFSTFENERRDPLTPFGSPVFDGNRTEVKYDGRVKLGATKLVFGAEYTKEEATFANGTFSAENFAAFGEVLYAIRDDIDVSGALRIDDHSDFGSAVTWRLAGAWRLNPQTTLKTSLGTGFRAPSLNELFGPFNFAGNPVLEPEESNSFDLGVTHDFANGATAEAVFFYNEIDNLITYPVNGYQQTPGTTRTRGLELSGRMPLSESVVLFGNYTLTEARDPNGAQTRRVPRHDLVMGVDAQITDRLSGQIIVNHVAGLAPDGFPAQPMPDFTVADMQVTYAVSDAADLYVRVENVFDQEYQRVNGFGTSDRAVFVGLRATF